MSDNLLSLKHVSKEYSGNKVLKDINIELKKGEIHALIGENGAGKSTLMNILFGMSVIHTTGGYEGTIEIEGKETHIKSPHDAMDYGIGMVHQEFMLIPGFSIMENVKLNREITKPNLVSPIFGKRLETLNIEQMNEDTRKALDLLDMDIEEYVQVAGLPVGHMQFIEIAREIDKTGIKILVFDEPTAVLAESEAANLLKAMKKLAQKGIGILFISHRLDEIIDVADVVTVLRDGEHVATKKVKDTNKYEIAQLMVGRSITIDREEGTNRNIVDETILDIENLFVAMPGERVKGVDIKVKKGEIVGIGGLAGQGKLGIANGIMGIFPAKGEVKFKGKKSALNDPKSAIKSGLAFVSEDRKGVGLLLDESIESNIAFSAMQIYNEFLVNAGPVKLKDSKKIREHANKMIKELDIRCTSSMQRVGSLSGGNQQKVCVARALTLAPELLLVSEPTRGIDIGAKKLVLDLLKQLNNEGMTIIMTSSELAELRSICDRILIICEGKVEGVLPPDAPDAEFGLMMSGSGNGNMEGREA
ncbi:MAG: sugar ABC transporter ATP-binding protein [Tissierellia bacterium]|jgi:simple sugar transport system ATP-binding protein|nr:sugar ABC transporter ATP-binding protein [Tissierellia bacterium]MDD3226985.1 sugar ABC transporter ATP-binding protein [Tissierellia bacterium]MDD3751073.1 sugar ABC transporter ATP-binding protein [Tissierellia bacterium]MDD4046363.1 sugar ABC transporter ATP-binding protein [Tissierellia bacterium]MDD4678300.1 sugar ABC transporter ATP-binding protein [Tissierellia bacterium]